MNNYAAQVSSGHFACDTHFCADTETCDYPGFCDLECGFCPTSGGSSQLSCVDDASFTDTNGFSCTDWSGCSCDSGACCSCTEYSDANQQALLDACPLSCGSCTATIPEDPNTGAGPCENLYDSQQQAGMCHQVSWVYFLEPSKRLWQRQPHYRDCCGLQMITSGYPCETNFCAEASCIYAGYCNQECGYCTSAALLPSRPLDG